MKSRKLIVLVLLAAVFLPLCSCWDYRGISDISVVTGIAIDKDPNNPKNYLVTMEMLSSVKNGVTDELDFALVESSGATLNEAVKKFPQKLKQNLSFSHVEVLLISHKLLSDIDFFSNLLDPIVRDSEVRDNLMTLVSQEATAKEIFGTDKDKKDVVSLELNRSISASASSNETFQPLELYQVYATLSSDLCDLVLPAVRKNPDVEGRLIVDHAALFRDQEFLGFVGDENLKYYNLVSSTVKDGDFTIHLEDDKYVSLTIKENSYHQDYSYDGKKFNFMIDLYIPNASAVEFYEFDTNLDHNTLLDLEEKASKEMSAKIKKMFEFVQKEKEADVMGFAKTIYRKDPGLWESIKEDWSELYADADITVNCKVDILDTEMQSRVVKEE